MLGSAEGVFWQVAIVPLTAPAVITGCPIMVVLNVAELLVVLLSVVGDDTLTVNAALPEAPAAGVIVNAITYVPPDANPPPFPSVSDKSPVIVLYEPVHPPGKLVTLNELRSIAPGIT